jgi:hypothetical protein
VRRAVLLALGVLVALAGSRALSAAGGMPWAYAPARDVDGFVRGPTWEIASDGYAVTGEHIDLVAEPGDWTGWVGRVEVRVEAARRAGEPVFVGVGPQAAVDTYLDVVHSVVTRGSDDDDAAYEPSPGVHHTQDRLAARVLDRIHHRHRGPDLDWAPQVAGRSS